MPDETPQLELESYLRLKHASHDEWLSAVRTLSGCDDMECHIADHQSEVGALSSLDSEGGQIVSVYASQDMEISGCQAEGVMMVLPPAGQAEVSCIPLNQLVVFGHRSYFRLRIGERRQVIFLKLAPELAGKVTSDCADWPLSSLRRLIESYLFKARFFLNDHQARTLTSELFRDLGTILETGKRTHIPACPKLDRRLLKVLEKFQHQPEWDFDLMELASHSGLSERNLYYLMKREIGITPYRLFQRCRLIRVRQKLVDCQCDVPRISRYAADEGFSHLGRFASLYRKHFGELPSETVQWRRNLLADASSERRVQVVSSRILEKPGLPG